MSRVVEGFYVRFFWDWFGFIFGVFRWKVFVVFVDYVGDISSLFRYTFFFFCGSGNIFVGVFLYRRYYRF